MSDFTNHPFFATFGPGPYRWVASRLGWTTCEHCGTGILCQFLIKAGGGNTFVVGSSCVSKAHKDAKADPYWDKALPAIVAEEKKMKAYNRHEREVEQVTRAMIANEAHLRSIPHPIQQRAAGGASLFDYLKYFVEADRSMATPKQYLRHYLPLSMAAARASIAEDQDKRVTAEAEGAEAKWFEVRAYGS